jgi:hypothetical protein
MHLMPPIPEGRPITSSELETIALSGEHLDYLDQMVYEMNPDMPPPFGWSHLICTLLEKFEQSGIDLTDASSEEEIAELAAGRLREQTAGPQDSETTATLFSSNRQSTYRRSYRSSRPETDRLRSGKTPRSGRG